MRHTTYIIGCAVLLALCVPVIVLYIKKGVLHTLEHKEKMRQYILQKWQGKKYKSKAEHQAEVKKDVTMSGQKLHSHARAHTHNAVAPVGGGAPAGDIPLGGPRDWQAGPGRPGAGGGGGLAAARHGGPGPRDGFVAPEPEPQVPGEGAVARRISMLDGGMQAPPQHAHERLRPMGQLAPLAALGAAAALGPPPGAPPAGPSMRSSRVLAGNAMHRHSRALGIDAPPRAQLQPLAAPGGEAGDGRVAGEPPGGDSCRRDCHFTDIPSPSVLKHPLKREGGAAE